MFNTLSSIGVAVFTFLSSLFGVTSEHVPSSDSSSHTKHLPFISEVHAQSTATTTKSGTWNDPTVWSTNQVPAANHKAVISSGHSITYNLTNTTVSGIEVGQGATLQFHPSMTTTLQTDANVVIEGRLVMKPSDYQYVQTLRFINIDESSFAGPGFGDVHHPIDSDVGLWVMGSGQLDIEGSEKQSWNRTGQHPTWRESDEYVMAPQERGESSAQPWNLGDPVPCVEFAGDEYCTEIVNLTRNVIIEGTPGGESHIFIRSNQPQFIKYMVGRHLGPNGDADIDGRYGFHFHMMHDGSRGSIVEGVVVRDTGDHAFVPHTSHGITFRDTVAYNIKNTAYWWDPGHSTHDTLYDRALALQVGSGRDSVGSLHGFRMARGERNTVVNSVAVGVSGGRGSTGFGWRDAAPNKWVFIDNVSHNNSNGIFHWVNEPFQAHERHNHYRNVIYRNVGWYGVEQGAYRIAAHWYDTVSFDNSSEGIISRGSPSRHQDIVYSRGIIGGGYNRSQHAIRIGHMQACPREAEIRFEYLRLLDWETTPILIDRGGSCPESDGVFVVRFKQVLLGEDERDLEPSDFTIPTGGIPPDGYVIVERTNGTAFKINHNNAVQVVNAADYPMHHPTPDEGSIVPEILEPPIITSLSEAHWKFDEGMGNTAMDSMGDAHGMLVNNPVWTTNGKRGGALRFDGSGAHVDLRGIDLSGEFLTISAWVNFSNLTGDPRIISKADGTAEQDHWWMLGEHNNKLRFRLKTNSNTDTLLADTGNIQINTWQHAAATYDGAVMRLYLDGVEVGSRAKSGHIDAISSVNAWIGGNPDGSNFLNGIIDDVRIYNRALDQAEIVTVMNAEDLPPTLKPGDVNGDGVVNLTDLSILLSNFGKSDMNRDQGDLNEDAVVNLSDLSILLANFGS